MSIQTISRIQHRRGVFSDLPINLNEGEFGWCLDTRQLFIGNGPGYGLNTQVLTEYSPNGQLITNQFRTATTTFISAATRPISAKLNDVTSVQDFGATGLGQIDDSVAINIAISSLLQGPYSNPIDRTRNIALKLPAGTYLLDSATITLFPYTTLIGDGPGKTILLAAPGTSLNPLFQTVDSLGQSTTNIGLNGATLPHKIILKDLTINTNNQPIDAIHLDRANNVRFENVEFIGAYVLGNNTDETHTALTLQSFGNAVGCFNFQFVSCWFYNFTYSVYIDDPINHIGSFNCFFTNLYRGWNIGEHSNFNGPSWTVVSGCEFDNIDDSGIIVFSPNPGVTSTSNTFHNVGISNDVLPIVWNTGTTLNTSIADIFDFGPGVLDNGTVDLILDAQQNNVNTLVGPTGPSITGPTGSASMITGPTGSSIIGPTGPGGSGSGNSNVLITSVSSDAPFYPTFVSGTSGNLGLYVDTGLSFNPSSNSLIVNGNITVNNSSQIGNLSITNTTTSTSSTSGALTVAGGAGINGNLYVGGLSTFNQLSTFHGAGLAATAINAGAYTTHTGWLQIDANSGGNIVWVNGLSNGPGTNPIWASVNASGVSNASNPAQFLLAIPSDQVNAESAGNGFIGLSLEHNIGGGNCAGSHTGMIIQVTQTGNINSTGNSNFIDGLNVWMTANNPLTGFGSGLIAFNPQINASSGATGLGLAELIEGGVSVVGNGLSSNLATRGAVVMFSGGNIQGFQDDFAFCATANDGQARFLSGLQFGRFNSAWPIDPTGNIILARPQGNGLGSGNVVYPQTASYGINFSTVDFNNFAFYSPGFAVGGNGNVHIGTARIAYTSTGAGIDVINYVGSNPTISIAGASYRAGDVLYGSDGAIIEVDTISGPGNIASWHFQHPPYSYGAAGPATMTLIGGSGDQTAVVGITWTQLKTLTLSPSGGPTIVSGNLIVLGNLIISSLPSSTSYANDTIAATGGVSVGQVYRNGSQMMVRVS